MQVPSPIATLKFPDVSFVLLHHQTPSSARRLKAAGWRAGDVVFELYWRTLPDHVPATPCHHSCTHIPVLMAKDHVRGFCNASHCTQTKMVSSKLTLHKLLRVHCLALSALLGKCYTHNTSTNNVLQK